MVLAGSATGRRTYCRKYSFLFKSRAHLLLLQTFPALLSLLSCLCHGLPRPEPRAQGPLSSSIPFFYVSGNPFRWAQYFPPPFFATKQFGTHFFSWNIPCRDILLQHQQVRERGLHGWASKNIINKNRLCSKTCGVDIDIEDIKKIKQK